MINDFFIKEKEILFSLPEYSFEQKWIKFWHGYSMLKESFSSESLNTHLNIFNEKYFSSFALETFVLLSILKKYNSNDNFLFIELGSGRAPWCLTIAGVITNKILSHIPNKYEVIAVEPEPTHYLWSCSHIYKQDINGDVIHAAISNNVGICNFLQSNDPAGDMGQYITKKGNIKVPVINIDHIVKKRNINHINLIHMDIQGEELNAIKGAESVINNNVVDYLIIATHSNKIASKLKKILINKYELILELLPNKKLEMSTFSKYFYSSDDGLQVYKSNKLFSNSING